MVINQVGDQGACSLSCMAETSRWAWWLLCCGPGSTEKRRGCCCLCVLVAVSSPMRDTRRSHNRQQQQQKQCPRCSAAHDWQENLVELLPETTGWGWKRPSNAGRVGRLRRSNGRADCAGTVPALPHAIHPVLPCLLAGVMCIPLSKTSIAALHAFPRRREHGSWLARKNHFVQPWLRPPMRQARPFSSSISSSNSSKWRTSACTRDLKKETKRRRTKRRTRMRTRLSSRPAWRCAAASSFASTPRPTASAYAQIPRNIASSSSGAASSALIASKKSARRLQCACDGCGSARRRRRSSRRRPSCTITITITMTITSTSTSTSSVSTSPSRDTSSRLWRASIGTSSGCSASKTRYSSCRLRHPRNQRNLPLHARMRTMSLGWPLDLRTLLMTMAAS
eukprot:m.194762 g.194762  ORF g.194762 m.194762 type:complete len:395 (+) comp10623_c0_seq1:842-2026(+)